MFSTMKAGNAHLREAHGIQLPWPKYEDGLVILDPSYLPHRGKRGHAKDFAPTPEEYARLLEAAEDELDRLAFKVLGEAGLRAKELLYLRPSWLREGTLHVPYRDAETGFRAKTRNADRAIPLWEMSREAWEILEEWITDPPRSARWGSPTPLGVSHATLWERVRRGGRRAGLSRRLFPHALRAYCATTWAYRLGNPFTLQVLMGWSSSKVAIAYVRSTGRALEDAVMAWNGNNGHNGGSMPSSESRPRVAEPRPAPRRGWGQDS